jgi:hypothetical protein
VLSGDRLRVVELDVTKDKSVKDLKLAVKNMLDDAGDYTILH